MAREQFLLLRRYGLSLVCRAVTRCGALDNLARKSSLALPRAISLKLSCITYILCVFRACASNYWLIRRIYYFCFQFVDSAPAYLFNKFQRIVKFVWIFVRLLRLFLFFCTSDKGFAKVEHFNNRNVFFFSSFFGEFKMLEKNSNVIWFVKMKSEKEKQPNGNANMHHRILFFSLPKRMKGTCLKYDWQCDTWKEC